MMFPRTVQEKRYVLRLNLPACPVYLRELGADELDRLVHVGAARVTWEVLFKWDLHHKFTPAPLNEI